MSISTPTEAVAINFSGKGEETRVSISGRLDAAALPQAWSEAVEPTRKQSPKRLLVDVSGLTYCDGAGLGLFAELRRIVVANGGEMKISGARPDQSRLLEMSQLKDPLAAQLQPVGRPGLITQTGMSAFQVASDMKEQIAFTGELTATLVWAAFHPQKIRWREMISVAEKAGANALPVVSLLGLLVGVILAFQTANPLQKFGAQPLIPTIVAIAVVREMGPLITAVILAGRSGSAFAAEIGTMQVTEELNALKTLGLEPVRFLVIPRVLAAMFVMPLLTVFNIMMSIVGGYFVMAALGYSLNFYVDSVKSAVTYKDLLGGLFKGLVFALIIAGIVLTIVADAILGVLFYYLGI